MPKTARKKRAKRTRNAVTPQIKKQMRVKVADLMASGVKKTRAAQVVAKELGFSFNTVLRHAFANGTPQVQTTPAPEVQADPIESYQFERNYTNSASGWVSDLRVLVGLLAKDSTTMTERNVLQRQIDLLLPGMPSDG